MKQKSKSSPQSVNALTANQVWIYGKHPVFAALLNPKRKIYQVLATKNSEAELRKFILEKKISLNQNLIKIVDSDLLSSLFPIGSSHQGLVLKTSIITTISNHQFLDKIKNFDKTNLPPLLILDNLTDPQNIGAIIRSAAAFGFKNIVIQDRNFPTHSAVIAKAAAGMLELVDLISTQNINNFLADSKKLGYWSVGLDGESRSNISEAKNYQPIAFVIGSEGDGIRRLVKENCDLLVKIPMENAVESLNASNAAAIAMYEIYHSYAK